MKYIAEGAKTMTLHSDPSCRENDSLTKVESGTELDIVNDTPFYGYNNREYILVKIDYHDEGYILKEFVRKKVACG